MKIIAILSLLVSAYCLQGCVFVPERGGPRYYPEERYHEGGYGYHGRHW